MKKTSLAFVAALSLVAASCSSNGWKVEGRLDNAQKGQKIALDGFNGINWYLIDSLEVGSNGKFAYSSPKGAVYPDVYRLSLDGKSLYFPIDSIETVTVVADASNFDRNYTLSGSATAQALMEIDQQIADALEAKGAVVVLSDEAFKRDLVAKMLADSVGTLSYYLLNKTIAGTPIFSTSNRDDVKIIGAVANRFNLNRPNDPRTSHLTTRFFEARKALGINPRPVVEAEAAGLIEIALPDHTGAKRSLSATAKDANVTVLNFTAYSLEQSPAYNVQLKKAYDTFAGNNIAIYQVSLDGDEVFWTTAAANVPWIAVRADESNAAYVLNSYAVDRLPLAYVIDRNGDITERVEDPAELDAAIRRALK